MLTSSNIPVAKRTVVIDTQTVTDGDINGYNNYLNKGFLLDSDYNTYPSTGTTTYQITKVDTNLTTGDPFQSATVTHRINKIKLNDFTDYYSPNVTNKLRQFKIYNRSTETGNKIYTYSNYSKTDTVSTPSDLKQALGNMVSITSSNIKDER